MSYYITAFDTCTAGGFILVGQWGDIYHPTRFGGLLMKLDSAGVFQWMTPFPGWEVFGNEDVVIFDRVEELADGSFAVVGSSCFEVPGEYDLFVARFNYTGSLLWNRSYPIEVSPRGCEIKAVADGFLATGAPGYSTNGMGNEPFLAKIDLAGNLQWIERAPIPMNGSYSLGISPDGGYVMHGGDAQMQVLCKLDSNLNILWQKQFAYAAIPPSLAGGLQDGKVWVVFEGPSENSTTISLLDAGGDSLWNTTTYWGVETAFLSPLQRTPEGGFLVGGQFVESTSSNITGFMAKMNSTGHLAWVRPVEVTGAETPLYWVAPAADGFVGVGTTANYTMIAFKTAYAIKLSSTEEPPFQMGTVKFEVQGIAEYPDEVLNIDGISYTAAQLPTSPSWESGTIHHFAWLSPIVVSEGKRHVWASTSGLSTEQSGSVLAPLTNGTIAAAYVSQYNVSILAAEGGSTDRSSGWYDASTSITVTPVPAPGYAFSNWEVSGSLSITGFQGGGIVVRVDGPGTISPKFEAVDLVPPTIAIISPANGSSLGSGNVTISASFSDNTGINASSTVLKIDGSPIADGVSADQAGITYTTTLQGGTHTVVLTVKDTYGNPQTATWSFTTPQSGGGFPLAYTIAIAVAIAATAGVAAFLMRRGKKAPP